MEMFFDIFYSTPTQKTVFFQLTNQDGSKIKLINDEIFHVGYFEKRQV